MVIFYLQLDNHEKSISEMGILNTDRIIIYCYSDLISSCRAWFQFLYFGHDSKISFSFKWWYEKMEIRK